MTAGNAGGGGGGGGGGIPLDPSRGAPQSSGQWVVVVMQAQQNSIVGEVREPLLPRAAHAQRG